MTVHDTPLLRTSTHRVTRPAVSRIRFGHGLCLGDVSSFALQHPHFSLVKLQRNRESRLPERPPPLERSSVEGSAGIPADNDPESGELTGKEQ
jgi:hypothetical protein